MLQGRTFWELLEKRVDATPDALMAVDEDMRTLTFAEYWTEAELAAAGLALAGIRAGDVVSWQLPTWIESMVLVAALSRLGAVQNPILPIYRDRELSHITKEAGTKLLVVPPVWRGFDYEELAREVALDNGDLRVLVSDRALPQGDPNVLPEPPRTAEDRDFEAWVPNIGDPDAEPDIHPEVLDSDPDADLGAPNSGRGRADWIFYTSGTTSAPKGAMHTDASLAAAARGMAQRLGLIQRDRNALVFPLSHIGGLVWLFASLQSGCSNILTESFNPVETTEVLAREGVTLAGSGTAFHNAYVAEQRKSLHPIFADVRAFPGGGAPKPPSLVEDVRALFDAPVLSGYGMTEAPILTMADLSDADDELATSEGKPLHGVEIRFVAHDGTIVTGNNEGELRVRAPQMMLGYVDPALDVEAFDDDGFFRTGDLGRMDERGNVIITGRVKDVIIRKGENVSAKELEDLLSGHELVVDVAVIGLPDRESGERVCAVIQVAEGDDKVTFDDVIVYLRDQGLMVQKLPEQVEFVDLLPRNQSGKVLKHVLRDEFKGSPKIG
ncbi:MAG: AMP-binding protein [Microthrixaceae bacterium]